MIERDRLPEKLLDAQETGRDREIDRGSREKEREQISTCMKMTCQLSFIFE